MPTQNHTYRLAAFYSLHPKPYTLKNFTFSAKERDVETGLSYFGSRYYSSDLSIWLSVDPQAAKYPGLSPFTYCADDPIKLVDPNGEEIDIDGYRYIPGQNCPDGASQKTQDKWNTLNKIHSTKIGESLINEMAYTEDYCISISSEISGKGYGQYVSNTDKTGGTIFTNGHNKNTKMIAHELFHGYQDMNGHSKRCIFNELEANIFTTMLGYGNNLGNTSDNIDGLYTNTLNKLLTGESFDVGSFNYVLNNFKNCATANNSGNYNNYPLYADDNPNGEFLIKQFFSKQ